MTTLDSKDRELLRVAADVVAGQRDPLALEEHDLSLGEPITGDEAKQMLLADLDAEVEVDHLREEHVGNADVLWRELSASGVEEGDRAQVRCLFSCEDLAIAKSIVAEFDGEGWSAVVRPTSKDGVHDVEVTTRPLVMGPEVFHALATQMFDVSQELGCEFQRVLGIEQAASKRPWWKLW